MADFSIDFSTLAEQTKWGKEALKSALLANINDGIKNELMLRELPSSLDALMTLCIWVDDRVCAHQSAHTHARVMSHWVFMGPPQQPAGCATPTHVSEPLSFSLSCNHMERICFFFVYSATHPTSAGSPLACTPQPAH